jgi:hypothetical protein
MVVPGRGPDGQEPVRPGSPLTSFEFFPEQASVYYIGTNDTVHELRTSGGGWAATDLFSGTVPGGPLASFALDGTYPRLYYVNTKSQITELAWRTKQWTIQYLPGVPADDSPLAGPVNVADLNLVYFVGNDRRIYELAGDQTGDFGLRAFPATDVAPGSSLLAVSQGDWVWVCYLKDGDTKLHALKYAPLTSPFHVFGGPVDGTEPAPGTALAGFGKTDTGDTRVYYLDRQSRINELTLTVETGTSQVLAYAARPGSALASFGVGGELARLYYLDEQAQVTELAWVHGQDGAAPHWNHNSLRHPAAADSALTCYGHAGQWTRLYYLDPDHRVNELAWDDTAGKFVHTGL